MEERFIMDLLKKIKEIIEKLNTILQLMQIKYKLYLLQIMLMKLLMRIGNNKIIKLTKTERLLQESSLRDSTRVLEPRKLREFLFQ